MTPVKQMLKVYAKALTAPANTMHKNGSCQNFSANRQIRNVIKTAQRAFGTAII